MDRILGGDTRNVGNITVYNSNVYLERKKMRDKDWWIDWFTQLGLIILFWGISMLLLGFL